VAVGRDGRNRQLDLTNAPDDIARQAADQVAQVDRVRSGIDISHE
jgi:hypothetical protein